MTPGSTAGQTSADMCVNCFRALGGSDFCTACGWPAHPPPGSPLHLPPRMLLKETYLLGRVLGHGGFGITYAAYDPALDRRLAIKEYLPNGEATRGTGEARIHPLSGASEEAFRWGLEKFLEEARVLVRFQDHPGIVKVITFFAENGTAYLVMEHLEGQNLETRLQQVGGKISFASALQVMMPVIDALREVHKTGILHRDISPDNVFLCDNRQIKLIDFGAARYAMGEKSKSLSILIKDGYAPEEQYRTKGRQGPWTDVYAVAATIYRSITGVLPPTSLDRLHDDELQDPRSLGAEIGEGAWQVLRKGLAVRASDRYESMEEFQAALLSTDEGRALVQAGLRITPAPPPPPIPPPSPIPTLLPTPKSQPPPPEPIVIPTPVPHPWWKRYAAVLGTFSVLLLSGVFLLQKGCGEPEPAVIAKFSANPAKVPASGQSTLEWKVTGAKEVQIEPGIGPRKPEGSLSISPLASTTYVLTAKNEAGKEVRQELRVEVEAAPAPTPTPETPQESTPTPEPLPPSDAQPRPKPNYQPQTPPYSPPSTITPQPLPPQAPPSPAPSSLTESPRILEFRVEPARGGPGRSVVWRVSGARIVSIQPGHPSLAAEGRLPIPVDFSGELRLLAIPAQGPPVSQTLELSSLTSPNSFNGDRNPLAQRQNGFLVHHDHQGLVGGILGSNRVNQIWQHCTGRLFIANGKLNFQSAQAGHSFSIPLNKIKEIKSNRLALAGRKAFHVDIAGGEKYNFVPEAAVSEVVDALNAALK